MNQILSHSSNYHKKNKEWIQAPMVEKTNKLLEASTVKKLKASVTGTVVNKMINKTTSVA